MKEIEIYNGLPVIEKRAVVNSSGKLLQSIICYDESQYGTIEIKVTLLELDKVSFTQELKTRTALDILRIYHTSPQAALEKLSQFDLLNLNHK